MFNQSKQRATTRVMARTEGGFKKTNTFHTTRVVTPSHRNFKTFKEKIMSQEKRNKSTSKKKNHRTLNIFKGVAKTLQVSSPSSIQYKHHSSQNSRKISVNNFNHRYLRINKNDEFRSKTPLFDNYFNKSNRGSEHQFIHEKVHEKCLSFVKQFSRPSQQFKQYYSFNNKQKILIELHKQAAGFGIELGQRNIMLNKQQKVVKPYLQLTRLGRMFGPSKADRERFRIDLTNEDFYQPAKLNKSLKIKKQLKYDQSTFQSAIKNNNMIVYQQPKQQQKQVIKFPLTIQPQVVQFKPYKRVEFKQKIQLSKLQQILSNQNMVEEKQFHQKSINKNTKSKIILADPFVKQQEQKKPQVMIKKQEEVTHMNDSIVEIILDTKQSDLIYQSEQDNQSDITKPISNPSKPGLLLESHNHLKTIQPIQPVITQDIIKNKNQQIRPIGEIIGHGLKVLKGININWILPCVFLYKRFYQLRVQIQNLAEQSDLQNEFICKNRYQNQRILQSYVNMIKAAEKKPITQQKQQKLRQSKVTDPVKIQDIVEQIQSYEQDISQFNGKQEDNSLIKSHFALILNSVLILAHHQKLIKQLYKINENNGDLNKEINKAFKLIRSLK